MDANLWKSTVNSEISWAKLTVKAWRSPVEYYRFTGDKEMLVDHNMNLSIENNLWEFHGRQVDFHGDSSARHEQFPQVLDAALVNLHELHTIQLDVVGLPSCYSILQLLLLVMSFLHVFIITICSECDIKQNQKQRRNKINKIANRYGLQSEFLLSFWFPFRFLTLDSKLKLQESCCW